METRTIVPRFNCTFYLIARAPPVAVASPKNGVTRFGVVAVVASQLLPVQHPVDSAGVPGGRTVCVTDFRVYGERSMLMVTVALIATVMVK